MRRLSVLGMSFRRGFLVAAIGSLAACVAFACGGSGGSTDLTDPSADAAAETSTADRADGQTADTGKPDVADTGSADTGSDAGDASTSSDGGADAADADGGGAADSGSDAGATTYFYGIDTSNRLVRFSKTALGTTSSLNLTGLQGGETIHGIDVRPVDGLLYGLGSTGRIYRIDRSTGATVQVGASTALTPALSGTSFGFDWNPTVDRLRVTSDLDQNFRLNPNDAGNAIVDTTLAYAVGDPRQGQNPSIGGCAYVAATDAGTTVLYAIDTTANALVIVNPPNNGALNSVGALGVNAPSVLGFDIVTEAGQQVGYVVMAPGGALASSLYTINLATGALTLVGVVGGSPLRALTHGT